jgi:hypothetical protein
MYDLIPIKMNDIAARENFSFNNFDELRGFLKGKIVVASEEQTEKVGLVLDTLGFDHRMRTIPIGAFLNRSQGLIYQIADESYQVYIMDEANKINGETLIPASDLIEMYFSLKCDLIAAILPYPVSYKDAEEMTREYLDRLEIFASTLLDSVEALDLDESSVDDLLGYLATKNAQEFLDNYEIQQDNLKYIW